MGVTSIAIKNSHLTGELPDLSQFPNLESLDYSGNALTGSMSDLCNLEKLKVLNLSGNTGITWEALPTTLTELYYSDTASDSTVRNIDWSELALLEKLEFWNCNKTISTNPIYMTAPKTSLKLRYYFASAQVKTIHLTLPSTVTHVDLSYCKFAGALNIYSDLMNLIELNVSNNSLLLCSAELPSALKATLLDFSNNILTRKRVDDKIADCLTNAQSRPLSGGITVPTCTLKLEGVNNESPSDTGKSNANSLRNLGWTVTHS
jgi:hypothetical protein